MFIFLHSVVGLWRGKAGFSGSRASPVIPSIISHTGSSVQVDSILRIARPGEKECMADCGVDNNHRLLWHGTKNSNMIGILQQGLRIAPPEAPTTGWSLGKVLVHAQCLSPSALFDEVFSHTPIQVQRTVFFRSKL